MLHLRHLKLALFCILVASRLQFQACAAFEPEAGAPEPGWISAADPARVVCSDHWKVTKFRYAAANHLATNEDGAALELRFTGTGLVLRTGGHAVPAYGVPNLGKLVITIDQRDARVVRPRDTPDEITIARGLKDGNHYVRIEHHEDNGLTGARIEGFRVLKYPTGDLRFTVTAEENAYLVDVRAVLKRGAVEIRNSLI